MHEEGGPPRWGVGLTLPSPVTGALFVRDRFAVETSLAIPLLTPDPGRSSVDRRPAPGAWDAWWSRLSDAGPAEPAVPDHDEALTAMWRFVEAEAQRWADRHTDVLPADQTGWMTAWLNEWMEAHLVPGSSVGLRIEAVSVRGAWHLALSRRRLLVSVEMLEDRAAVAPVLDEALRAALVADDDR